MKRLIVFNPWVWTGKSTIIPGASTGAQSRSGCRDSWTFRCRRYLRSRSAPVMMDELLPSLGCRVCFSGSGRAPIASPHRQREGRQKSFRYEDMRSNKSAGQQSLGRRRVRLFLMLHHARIDPGLDPAVETTVQAMARASDQRRYIGPDFGQSLQNRPASRCGSRFAGLAGGETFTRTLHLPRQRTWR